MAGILGDFLGLGGTQAPTPGLLDAAGYMDPAQYDRMRQNQSMMGLWAGLLAGGGPSLSPRNFGSALGAGLTGAQQFGSQFDESQLHSAQAAQARANVGKLATEAETMRQGYDITRKAIESGMFAGGKPGAAAPGSGSSTPNFGAGLTGAPGRLASADIYKLATDVGFKGDAAETMTAIIQGESGNRPGAIGDQSIGGSYGLTQINRKAHGDVALEALNNPRRALELAYDISKGGTDFSPWSVYKSGAYKQYLGRTQASADGGAVPDFAGGRSLTLPGTLAAGEDALRGTPPVPSVLTTPAAPVPTILTAPGSQPNAPGAGAALTQQQQNAAALAQTGRPIFPPGTKFNSRGEAISPDLTATLPGQRSGANIPPDVVQGFARANAGAPGAAVGAPVNVRPLAGDAVPAEAVGGGPSLGVGGVFSPAAIAAAQASGMPPPVPAAMVPPAAAPAPGATQPAAAAAAPAPSGTQPAGPLTVTLPAPLAPLPPAALPAPPTPQAATLPPQPTMPAIPPRPEIPGAPGAAGGGGYNAQAHQAQMMALGLTMMGRTVPGFISDLAGIPAAGQKAAAEALAKQPFEIQNKQIDFLYNMAKSTWEKSADFEKDRIAAANGLTTAQYKAQLDQIGKDREAQQAQQGEQYKKQLEISGAGIIESAKTGAAAENAQTTMIVNGQERPMTVGQANRIARGEPPEQVLGPNAFNLGKPYQTPEEIARAQAGATKSVDYSFKRLEEADNAGDAANRSLQTFGQLAKAAEGFKTGPTAALWLDVKRYARDAGLITGADVPDGELIRQGTTKLAIQGAPRQGSVSNYERGLYSRINPELVNSPEAFAELIRIGARLDQYDQQVSQIHNDVARDNKGVPNYLEANTRIRALGPPISPQERAALERLQKGGGGAGSAAPAAPSGTPEYRWDPAANGGQGALVPNTGR